MKGRSINKAQFIAMIAILIVAVSSRLVIGNNYSLANDHINHALWFDDMVKNHNYLLSGWYIVKNNGLFTELVPVQFPLGVLIGMNSFSIRLGAIMVFFLLGTVLFIVLRRMYGRGAAFAGLMALVAAPVYSSQYYLMPNFHVGTILFAVLCFWLLLVNIKSRGEEDWRGFIITAIVISFLSITSVFSDYLFIVIFTVPAAVSIMAMHVIFRKQLIPWKKEIIVISLLLISGLIGMVLASRTEVVGLHLAFAAPNEMISLTVPSIMGAFMQSASQLAEILNMDFLGDGYSLLGRAFKAANLLLFIGACIEAAYLLIKEADSNRKLYALFSVITAVLLFAAHVARKVAHPYYLIPLLYVYAMFIACALAGNSFVSGRRLRTFLIAIFILAASHNVYEGFKYEKQEQPFAGLSDFLVQNDLKYGYAFYEESNIITFLTDGEVKIRPVRFNRHVIEPDIFHVKMDWYHYKKYTGPTFLLVRSSVNSRGFGELTPSLIRQMFGSPARTLRYGDADIYEWNYNIIQAYWINTAISGMGKPQGIN